MLQSKKYSPELILTVGFGKYGNYSIEQLPLNEPDGFSYLDDFLKGLKNISAYDREQIENVTRAFGDFPAEIKCHGAGKNCDNKASKIVLPNEFVHKHDKQSGPEWRRQIEVTQNPFYCDECAKIYAEYYKAGSREKGIVAAPISFSVLKRGNAPKDLNLNREKLHGVLRRFAYEVLEQGKEIDGLKIDYKRNIYITKEKAKKIVNILLGVDENNWPEQLSLFDEAEVKKEIAYKERPIFKFEKKASDPNQKKLKL